MSWSSNWKNPTPPARYQLLVVGGGPAGVAAAQEAARRGAKVALIERRLLGGTCLNEGCIPSKTLIRTSRLYREMRDAERFGARVPDGVVVDFGAAMERVRSVRARLTERDTAEGLVAMGIDLYFGEARFAGPAAVTVGSQRLSFDKALIATGARPSGLSCRHRVRTARRAPCTRKSGGVGRSPSACGSRVRRRP